MWFILKTWTFLKIRIKAKKVYRVLEFTQFQWLKQFVEFNTQKRIEAEKHGDKDGIALHKSMDNAVYGKTMGNLRNRLDVKFACCNKRLFKMDIQIKLYVTQNISQWFSRDN